MNKERKTLNIDTAINKQNVLDEENVAAKKIFGVNVYALILSACIVAFAGFVIENVFRLFCIGVIDDRHRLFPFIAEYGIAYFAIFLLFGTPKNMRIFTKKITITAKNKKAAAFLQTALYFLIVFLCIGLGEITVGLTVEKTMGIKGWNFSNIPLHITRYTSIPTDFAYTSAFTVFMHLFFDKMTDALSEISPKVLKILAIVLTTTILLDSLIMLCHGMMHNKYPSYWRIVLQLKHLKR